MYGHFSSISFRICAEMRKDSLGFHQFETIALMPCFSMNMNLFLEECGVFCQVFFINVTNKNS